ncbi:Chromobox-like protein 5 [Aphelenchoides bicaudatus]|nr:Chromobox-like protein 5 [Aphelenchoides bicaudatus]
MGRKSKKSEEKEQSWEVEKILDRRYLKGKPEYLLKWKDWDGEPTWQALNKGDCPELLKAFEKECREKESRGRRTSNHRERSRVIIDESEDSEQEPSTSTSAAKGKSKRSTTPSTAKKQPAKKATRSKRKTSSPNSSSTRSRSTSHMQLDETDQNNFPSLSSSEDELIEKSKKNTQKEKPKPIRASKRLSSNKNGVAAKQARRDSVETVTLDDDEDDEPPDPKPTEVQRREPSPARSIKSTNDQAREPSPARSIASDNSENGNLVIDEQAAQVDDSMDTDENVEQASTANNRTSVEIENFFENIDTSFLQLSPAKISSQTPESTTQKPAENATEQTSSESEVANSSHNFQQILNALLVFSQAGQINDVTESNEAAKEQIDDVTNSNEAAKEQIDESNVNEPTSENNLNETDRTQQLETSIETVNDQPFSSFQTSTSLDKTEQATLVIDEEQNVSTKTAVELEIRMETVEVGEDQTSTNEV